MLVVEHGGPTMFAGIGVMRALNRGHVREFNPARKDPHWGGGSSRGTNDSLGLCRHDKKVGDRDHLKVFMTRMPPNDGSRTMIRKGSPSRIQLSVTAHKIALWEPGHRDLIFVRGLWRDT